MKKNCNLIDEFASPLIFSFTKRGKALAEDISSLFTGSSLHNPEGLKGGGLKAAVRRAFKPNGPPLIFIGAVGIAVRMIAPLLQGKAKDPPVVVIGDDGRFVISLISGHLGGANLLAEGLAAAIGATPVITTATDIAGLPCIEDVSKAFGILIENPSSIKYINSAILRDEKVVVIDANRERLNEMKKLFGPEGVFIFKSRLLKKPPKDIPLVVISPRLDTNLYGREVLILRPKEIVVGIGCRRGVPASVIKAAVESALTSSGLSPNAIRNLATADVKMDEEGLTLFADEAGLKIDCFSREELNTIEAPSGVTKKALEKFGIRAVAEPAAILSAGAEKLCIKKIKSGTVTVAAAMVPFKL